MSRLFGEIFLMATPFVSSLGTILICVYLRGLVYGEEEVHGSFEEMRDILKRVKALEASVSSLKSSVSGLQRPVAFSAYYSEKAASLTEDIKEGSIFVFDQTATNKDGVYSTKTGKFKAPSSGTYAFTWTLCADSRIDNGGYGEFGSELVVGSSVYGKLQVDTEVKYDDDCSTSFVIVNVKAGQEVYLRNIYAHQGRLLSKEGETRTTFSGWMIYSNGTGIALPTCPDQNWKQHGTSCYYFSTQILSWNKAQNYCQKFGGYLVEISSSVENSYIKTEIKKRFRHANLNGNKVYGYWTGLKKINNQWIWANSKAKLTYTNWNPGEPNNTGELCVHFTYHLNFNWNDYWCINSEYFVCEKKMIWGGL